ncbi:hypothetical protein CHARACLAT_007135 [Characodon lateralis]|uniref:Uncharacterized protein n=1 Tax=Characodon lateralis TaxID=208331 RepID=A0ABU7CYH6_9TELE|nr:hypothetical protein [Characodon lateralis]
MDRTNFQPKKASPCGSWWWSNLRTSWSGSYCWLPASPLEQVRCFCQTGNKTMNQNSVCCGASNCDPGCSLREEKVIEWRREGILPV